MIYIGLEYVCILLKILWNVGYIYVDIKYVYLLRLCFIFISNFYSKSNKINKKLWWVIYLLYDFFVRKKFFLIDM